MLFTRPCPVGKRDFSYPPHECSFILPTHLNFVSCPSNHARPAPRGIFLEVAAIKNLFNSAKRIIDM